MAKHAAGGARPLTRYELESAIRDMLSGNAELGEDTDDLIESLIDSVELYAEMDDEEEEEDEPQGDSSVKYPKIWVQLTGPGGPGGNAFNMAGAVRAAMRRARVPHEEIEEFSTEALAGDYDHVIATCMKWVNVR